MPLDDVWALAQQHYQHDRLLEARDICDRMLARAPAHVDALNLRGVLAMRDGRNELAIGLFEKALAVDPSHGGSHYNIASAYQARGEIAKAVGHFRSAIISGMSNQEILARVARSPTVLAGLSNPEKPIGIADVAGDAFLQAALTSIPMQGIEMESFLTRLRAVLLRTIFDTPDDTRIIDCMAALAQQCFINEYLFDYTEDEAGIVGRLRERLHEPGAVAAIAAYAPLQSVPDANWPSSVAQLIKQQILEPAEERQCRAQIPTLTAIDEASLPVQQQYEQNPYPRWVLPPLPGRIQRGTQDILIAGCGSGLHPIQTALTFPDAKLVAIDLSLSSLAYGLRKARELGVTNIGFGQADILKLASLDRTFDRIEAIGVLHHLADPLVGWRVLLSLLRQNGEMRVALYSRVARRPIRKLRAIIAELGFQPTANDIREVRRSLMQSKWKELAGSYDFYSISGCRDLMFNMVEHQFTISQLKVFLQEHGLEFLGFELDRQGGQPALTDLDGWNRFEIANPHTFRRMYIFSVRRR